MKKTMIQAPTQIYIYEVCKGNPRIDKTFEVVDSYMTWIEARNKMAQLRNEYNTSDYYVREDYIGWKYPKFTGKEAQKYDPEIVHNVN